MAAHPTSDELTQLKQKLKDSQDQITALTQTVTTIQAQVKSLEAKQADIQKALTGYDQLSKSIEQQLTEVESSISQKTAMAEAAVKDVKPKIDKTIADFDDALKQQSDAAKAAWDSSRKAAADSDASAQAAQQKDLQYASIRSLPKALDGQMKDLKGLVDQAAKAEAQGDVVAMYFLLSEASTLANGLKIPTQEEYQASLTEAQDAAESAKADAATKKTNADQLSAAYTSAKAKSDAAQASRRPDLLKSLKTIKVPVAA
jgi:DNA repair exonuclease SbcCD ATPase subunit